MPIAVPYKPYKDLDTDIKAVLDSVKDSSSLASLASRGMGTYDGQDLQGRLKFHTGLLAIKEMINGNFSLAFEAQKAAEEILHPDFGQDYATVKLSTPQMRLLTALGMAVHYSLENGIGNTIQGPRK